MDERDDQPFDPYSSSLSQTFKAGQKKEALDFGLAKGRDEQEQQEYDEEDEDEREEEGDPATNESNPKQKEGKEGEPDTESKDQDK